MTDPNPALLPPDLALHGDDVLEAVEVVAEPDLEEDLLDHGDHGDHGDHDDHGDHGDHGAGSAEARVSGFDGIGTRRESRERALALLYEAEQRLIDPPAALIDQLPVPPEAFAGQLVVGVSEHLGEIDDLLRRYSVSWPLERMPALDRALLRLGTYELVFTDVPVGACISEAVELAKRYSTDDSHKFVNGMLARVADEVRAGR